jgi:hypothetical protein
MLELIGAGCDVFMCGHLACFANATNQGRLTETGTWYDTVAVAIDRMGMGHTHIQLYKIRHFLFFLPQFLSALTS